MRVQINEIEVKLLLEGIRLKYGYDFRQYAESSIFRRVEAVARVFESTDILGILRRVLDDRAYFLEVLPYLTVGTSEMFRDPLFFRALRDDVIPVLRTYPTFNIWSAGCSTGEEVFSLAILLREEGLTDRAVIYATDINPRSIKQARDGIYSTETIKTSIRNYQEAGGKSSFSDYYTADYGLAKMNSDLLSNVVFAEHNLVTDQVFAECHLVLCRNVLIYFNKDLQGRVLKLFESSLLHRGFMSLGSKESIRFSDCATSFDTVNDKWRIYRKTSHTLKRGLNV